MVASPFVLASAGRFWPDRATQRLLSPAPHWMLRGTAPQERVNGLLQPLLGWYQARLQSVPENWLTTDARERLVRLLPQMLDGSNFPLDPGFGAVMRTANGTDATAPWFLEQGILAWQHLITTWREQRLWPDSPLAANSTRIEDLWATKGPAETAAQLDRLSGNDPTRDPVLAIYRLPLALWHDRNGDLAIKCIDFLIQMLSPQALAAAGATWPLTIALAHGLRGNVTSAAAILDEGMSVSRPEGWTGLTTAEARYQRGRYLWDSGNTDAALVLLDLAMDVDPAYVLRVVSDPGWLETNPIGQEDLKGRLGKRYADASSNWTRWIHSGGGKTLENRTDRRLLAQEAIQVVGAEAWALIAAAHTLPKQGVGRSVSFDPQFLANLERVREVLGDLPKDLRIRSTESDAAPMLCFGAETELTRLEHAVGARDGVRMVQCVEFLQENLVPMLSKGLLAHGRSQAMALAAILEVLEPEARTDFIMQWGETVNDLLKRCTDQIAPVRELAGQGTVGVDVSRRAGLIWDAFENIDDELVRFFRRSFGQLQIIPAPGVDKIRVLAGKFTAARVIVQDAVGTPVGAVPIVWHVERGPAVVRDGDPLLVDARAVSLKTGQAYLTITAPEGTVGEHGVIEAHLLDDPTPLAIPYEIV